MQSGITAVGGMTGGAAANRGAALLDGQPTVTAGLPPVPGKLIRCPMPTAAARCRG